MSLRIATWNMRGGGTLTPQILVDLILDPVNMGTGAASTSSKKRKSAPVEPIDFIALQEFPLATGPGSYHQQVINELAGRLQTADYRVSAVYSSLTKINQLTADIWYQDLARVGLGSARALVDKSARIMQTDTGKSDAYAFIYNRTKIGNITFPDSSTSVANPHKTARYTRTTSRGNVAGAGLNDLVAGTRRVELGRTVFSDSLTKAFFLHRPLYARCNAGGTTLHVYSWHAPEEGVRMAKSPQTRFYAYEAIRLFKAFNFSSISGGLAAATGRNDIILVMGDLNAARQDVDIFPAGGLRQHLSVELDHILLGGGPGRSLTKVPGILDVIAAGYSDHYLVVADLAGAAVATSSSSTASTAVSSTSTGAAGGGAASSGGTAKKARTGASPAPKRRPATKKAGKK